MLKKLNIILMMALVLSLSNCSNKKRAMTTDPGKSVLPSNSNAGNTATPDAIGTPSAPTNAAPLNSTIQPVIDGTIEPTQSTQTPSAAGTVAVNSVQEFISSAASSASSALSYLIGSNSSQWKITVQQK